MDRSLLERSNAVKQELLKRQGDDGLRSFEPHAKQRKVIDAILKDQETMVMFFGANRCGKCLPLYEPVLMADGEWKPLRDIKIGDEVIAFQMEGQKGVPAKVTNTWRSGKQPVYRTIFSDGGSIHCTANHEIPGYTRSGMTYVHHGKKIKNIPKKRLLSEYINRKATSTSLRSRFLSPKTIQFNKTDLPLHPYLVGAILGDGSIRTGIHFTTADKEIVDRMVSVSPEGVILRDDGDYLYRLVYMKGNMGNPIVNNLKALGIRHGDKHIPGVYLSSSEEERLQLLAGLIDTDGSTNEFVSKYDALAEGFCYLVRSLGGKATKSVTMKKCVNTGAIGEYRRVYWRLNREIPLTLSRKHSRPTKRAVDYSARTVRSIDLIGAFETGCITVDHPDHCFVAGDWVAVGNSDLGGYIDASLARFGLEDPPSNYSGSGDGFIEVRDRATSGWVVSLDFPSSRDIIQPKIFNNGFVPPGAHPPFIPEREIAEWRVTDQILKLKNGSIIGFKSCDSKEKKFQGAGKDYIHFDEEPPYEVFEESTIRVEAGRKLMVFATCTLLPPIGEAGGVTWMYDRFVKPWKKGTAEDFKLFTASIYDNPFIGQDELRYLEAMFPPGSRSRRIRLEGELLPGLGGSRAYGSFEEEFHVKPQGDLLQYRPLCWTWDFNVEPMVSLIGQRDGDIFRFKGELALDEGNIPDMCQLFYHRFGHFKGDIWIYGDATGQGRNAQFSQSDYTVISNELRRYGINFKMKVPTTNPLVQDRLNAFNRALKDEIGRMTVEIDPSCKELIDDLDQVQMDPRGGIKKSHNRKEAYYQRTHASDAAGYWINYEAPIRPMSIRQRILRAIPSVSYARR